MAMARRNVPNQAIYKLFFPHVLEIFSIFSIPAGSSRVEESSLIVSSGGA